MAAKGEIFKRKHLIRLICFLAVSIAMTGCGKAAEEKPEEHQIAGVVGSTLFKDNKNGTVSFSYNNDNKTKCKVVTQIEGGKMYQYDIPEGQCDFVFPLSQGNGVYRLYLCKNTTGNKYSIVESANITLNLKDELSPFLESNYIINWNTENEAIKKAYELTKGMTDDTEKIEAIYEYMVKNFSYDYEKMKAVDQGTEGKAYVPDIDSTYDVKMGICYDLSALTASMLRSVSIPAKVVTGYTSTTISYHAWNRIYLQTKKEWKTSDVTYDIQMYKDGKRYSIFKRDEYYSDIMYEY